MTLDPALREQVRERAGYACEFCGITETDAGGPLTIDHFQPRAHGGADHLDNLIYCCANCNQYKLDYWPSGPNAPILWNPRLEPAERHFWEDADGKLHPLTSSASFAIQRLRLNRPALLAHRWRRQQQTETVRLLTRYRDLVQLLEQMQAQQAELLQEQQLLLAEQRSLLRLLLGRS